MANKKKTVYVCAECGHESSNWSGKCPACGMWNTMKEMSLESKTVAKSSGYSGGRPKAKKMNQLDTEAEIRFATGISEFDRVLGGGAVLGSLNLVGGAPGIGKSTLLLQMCATLEPGRRILYVTAEESERQLKLRAQRLSVENEELYVLAETSLETILAVTEDTKPEILILDSIQTVANTEVDSAPGSVTQVRECTMRLMRLAKEEGITVFVVGHITKEGSIAGPKVLEHMVDLSLIHI